VGQPRTAINIEYNSRRERSLLQELSFDAWGDRRNPATWRSFTGTPPEPLFDRGFTGHEHLYAFGLINMNGRMYDPLVSRMLSPEDKGLLPKTGTVQLSLRCVANRSNKSQDLPA